MPLVTRQANQGSLFKTETEPPDWLDGDLWSDLTNNNLKLNVNGTATLIGGRSVMVKSGGSSNSAIGSFAATRFDEVLGIAYDNGSATETDRQNIMARAITLTDLSLHLPTNTTNGNYIYRVRLNAATTDLSITVPNATSGEFSDNDESVDVAANDNLAYEGDISAASSGALNMRSSSIGYE